MIDLSRRGNLGAAENFWVCSAIQAVALDEIFRSTKWDSRDAVFHGGTAIDIVHGSSRFSEDLDFMVSNKSLDSLARSAPAIGQRIAARMGYVTKDAKVAFSAAPQRPGRDRMDSWDIRWSHPNRFGVARVKCEFYAVAPSLLSRYRTGNFTSVPGGGAFRITTPVPAADLVSLWGDKIKAIATRNDFKMRDAHDLGFLSATFDQNGCRPPEEDLLTAVSLSCALYDKEPSEIAEGLARRLADGTTERYGDYLGDMSRWFDDRSFRTMSDSGMLKDYWERTWAEIRFGMDLINEAAATPAAMAGTCP